MRAWPIVREASLFLFFALLYYGLIGPLALVSRVWRLHPMAREPDCSYWRRHRDLPDDMNFWSRPW